MRLPCIGDMIVTDLARVVYSTMREPQWTLVEGSLRYHERKAG